MESRTTQQREIANLGVLDLTRMQRADDLNAISKIVPFNFTYRPDTTPKRAKGKPATSSTNFEWQPYLKLA